VKYDGFRSWLFARLLGTRYATVRLDDSEIDAVAKKIGVDPDLLLEVRAQALITLHSRGLSPPLSNSGRRKKALDDALQRIHQFQIWFPRVVFQAWRAECEIRAVHPTTFLRSLIHFYLLGSWEPEPVKHWAWEGKLYRFYKNERVSERAVITHGAKRALMRRASLRGTQATNIVRALILGAMRGEQQGLPLVTAGMMFDDESRYNTGEIQAP